MVYESIDHGNDITCHAVPVVLFLVFPTKKKYCKKQINHNFPCGLRLVVPLEFWTFYDVISMIYKSVLDHGSEIHKSQPMPWFSLCLIIFSRYHSNFKLIIPWNYRVLYAKPPYAIADWSMCKHSLLCMYKVTELNLYWMAILREPTSGGFIELGRSTEVHHSSA